MEHSISQYVAADLEQLTVFLNKTWEFDTITKELLVEKLSGDPDWQPELALVHRKDKQIIGFMQAVIRDIRETSYGYIKLMGVDEKYRRQGIEVRQAKTKDKQYVINFINDEWPLWSTEVEMAFKDNPPSVHIALSKGEVKAFSAHNGNNKGTAWFGPMAGPSGLTF